MIARALLTLVVVVSPLTVDAAVPDPTKSRGDSILVGNSSGRDMGNAFHVTVRDVSNNPLPGKFVFFHFVGTARPCVQQEQGSTVDCGALTLTRISDGVGEVVFHARIAGFDDGNVAEVRMSGVLLKRIPVRSTDLDGDGTTDLRDLNLFRQRFLFDHGAPETDFDLNGITNGFDLDRMREEIVFPTHGTVCP